jgi:hypothetical protein
MTLPHGQQRLKAGGPTTAILAKRDQTGHKSGDEGHIG